MKLTIGRVVIYNTTAYEREMMFESGNGPLQLPAIIVSVWGKGKNPPINVQVLTDNSDNILWKISISRGNDEGQWNWPKKAKLKAEAKAQAKAQELEKLKFERILKQLEYEAKVLKNNG
jgi:hypothetical protein